MPYQRHLPAPEPGLRARRALREVLRQTAMIVALLFALTLVGTVGLRATTGAPLFDCLYLTVITLSTVGYSEVIPLGSAGRAFIMGFLALGFGAFTFSAFTLGSLMMSAQVRQFWQWRRMQAEVDRLKGHYIICGAGAMGVIIAEYLHQRGQAFLIIDHDERKIADVCTPCGWLSIVGDATDNRTLLAAGIKRARALAAALPTDPDNVYVVLSARMLAPDLQIVARAGDLRAVEKLQHAGAARVVSPFTSGAEKMARFMLSPSVEDFLEVAAPGGQGLELADIHVLPGSSYVGQTLDGTGLRARGVLVVGLRRSDGESRLAPEGDYRIEAGDSLFLFGSVQAVNAVAGDSGIQRGARSG